MLRDKLIAVVLVLPVLAGAPAAAQQGPASVVVEPVVSREIAETTPIIAQLTGTVEAEVATRAAGVVEGVLFEVGDTVEGGQELARLDDRTFAIALRNAEAALEAARAGVAVAEARAALARQAFERQSRLQGSAAFSLGQFEDLEQTQVERLSEVSRAEAQVAVSEAELARAELDMSYTVIRAPFGGVVVERIAQPGQYISLGDAVARLLDIDRLEIEADMPVELVGALAPGRSVTASFGPELSAEATVRTLLPVEAVSTRTRAVRLSVDTTGFPRHELADGRSVILRVPVSAPREAILVPKDALVQSQGGWTVFLPEDGKAASRQVTIGKANGDRMEVLSGLVPGDLVVVRGNERLRPGQPIAPRLPDGSPAEAGAGPAPEAPAAAPDPASGDGEERADPDASAARRSEGVSLETPVTPASDVRSGSAGAATLQAGKAAPATTPRPVAAGDG